MSFTGTLMPFFAHNLIQVSIALPLPPSLHDACGDFSWFRLVIHWYSLARHCKLLSKVVSLYSFLPYHCLARILTHLALLWQVTREWLNWEGASTVEHLVALFLAMEADPRVQRALR